MRDARAVVQQLLNEMNEIVRDYHPDGGRTPLTVDELRQGTSFFPGGLGLWRGVDNQNPPREYFPDSPIMLVAHNYDSIDGVRTARPWTKWRDVMLPLLEEAGVDPFDVFFTNALMGLKPGSALGNMPTFGDYEKQCKQFLKRQIEIVNPRIAVALGDDSHERLRQVSPGAASIYHPSARQFNKLATRTEVIRIQAAKLRKIIDLARVKSSSSN